MYDCRPFLVICSREIKEETKKEDRDVGGGTKTGEAKATDIAEVKDTEMTGADYEWGAAILRRWRMHGTSDEVVGFERSSVNLVNCTGWLHESITGSEVDGERLSNRNISLYETP